MMDKQAKRFAPGSATFKTWNFCAIAAIVVISILHYTTHSDVGNIDSHALFRRLYYLPIAMLAVTYGLKGGGFAAGAVVLIYIPHAFLSEQLMPLGIHLHHDPASNFEKIAEMILYLSLGLMVGFAVDLARKTQLSLDNTQEELSRAAHLASLGELVAGVAHEIKNPLASLHTTAEMFLDDYDAAHKKRRMAELNFEEVKRLEGIVERFLSFAKPGQVMPSQSNAHDILERLESLVKSTAREANVDVRFTSSENANVIGDADQILQMLLNVVLNAIEASPPQSKVVVAVTCTARGCEWTVDDAGAGIKEEDRERIFDPFYTSRAEGSGLGLSISARIVQSHQGTIRSEKSPLGGTRFLIHLPSAPSSSQGAA